MNRLTRVATAAVMMMWFALTIGAPPARAAVTITVDPGLFTGVWSLNGISYTGSQTLSVDPRAAIPVSIAGAVFFISVDASGTVVSQNTAAATASGFDPQRGLHYRRPWRLRPPGPGIQGHLEHSGTPVEHQR